MKKQNFYYKNKNGYIIQELAINYDNKKYKIYKKRRTKIVNEKIKELKKFGFMEEKDV